MHAVDEVGEGIRGDLSVGVDLYVFKETGELAIPGAANRP
jgi:hypothetical protein